MQNSNIKAQPKQLASLSSRYHLSPVRINNKNSNVSPLTDNKRVPHIIAKIFSNAFYFEVHRSVSEDIHPIRNNRANFRNHSRSLGPILNIKTNPPRSGVNGIIVHGIRSTYSPFISSKTQVITRSMLTSLKKETNNSLYDRKAYPITIHKRRMMSTSHVVSAIAFSCAIANSIHAITSNQVIHHIKKNQIQPFIDVATEVALDNEKGVSQYKGVFFHSSFALKISAQRNNTWMLFIRKVILKLLLNFRRWLKRILEFFTNQRLSQNLKKITPKT